MRILRIAQKVYPDVKGGGPYHVHAMSRDQATEGHDVTVLTIGDGPPREERDSYTVIRKPALFEPLGNAISPSAARFLQQVGEFDVIHAHSHLYFLTNLAAFERQFCGTPLAITNHGLYSQTAPEWIFDVYLETLGRWTFNQADSVFCYTDTDKTRLRQLGVESPIEVVSNGIDTKRFTLHGPESELINADGPVMLFVGRLVEGKRPEIAVEAFEDVLVEYPDAELYLCGDGPLRGELETQVRDLGVGESVHFLGHVPYDEMPAVYRAADTLVLPSRTEGVPRTVLEAMASEVPVVVSDLEQMDGVISDGGRTVSVEDGEFGTAVLESLAGDGGGTRERVLENYRWAETVERTTAALESICR
jgi:glycogen(starch) synthase